MGGWVTQTTPQKTRRKQVRTGWRRRKSGGPRGSAGCGLARGRCMACRGGPGPGASKNQNSKNPCYSLSYEPVRQSLQLAINDTVFAAGTIHGPALRTWPKCASRPRWPMHAPFYSMRWRQGADGLRPVVQYSGVDALASPFFPACPSVCLCLSGLGRRPQARQPPGLAAER